VVGASITTGCDGVAVSFSLAFIGSIILCVCVCARVCVCVLDCSGFLAVAFVARMYLKIYQILRTVHY
jgi:hypothetical protein